MSVYPGLPARDLTLRRSHPKERLRSKDLADLAHLAPLVRRETGPRRRISREVRRAELGLVVGELAVSALLFVSLELLIDVFACDFALVKVLDAPAKEVLLGLEACL